MPKSSSAKSRSRRRSALSTTLHAAANCAAPACESNRANGHCAAPAHVTPSGVPAGLDGVDESVAAERCGAKRQEIDDGFGAQRQEPDAVGRECAEEIRRHAPSITKAVIAAAEEQGSYLHAKFLFEFAGIAAPSSSPTASPDQSLAAQLLRALGVKTGHTTDAPPVTSEEVRAPEHNL